MYTVMLSNLGCLILTRISLSEQINGEQQKLLNLFSLSKRVNNWSVIHNKIHQDY